MASTSAFYTSSDGDYERKAEIQSSLKTETEHINLVYEIDRCVTWIEKVGYSRVALQFPDEMMADAVAVTTQLEKAVSQTRVFILGDTSYGSCCVDEVAAQHYNADAVIHFGRSCLSQPCQMPVLFVFGQFPVDIDNCVDQFSALFPDLSADVIVLYDTVYAYIIDELATRLQKNYTHVVVSKFEVNKETVCKTTMKITVQESESSHKSEPAQTSEPTQKSEPAQTTEPVQTSEPMSSSGSQQTLTLCGRTFSIPCDKTLSDFSVFYLGKEGLTLTNIMYQYQPCDIYTYNPETKQGRKEGINVNKMLMKRYFMVEKAKDASIVGILIGTLGVANYHQMLNRLKELLYKAGKKSYVFLVGKINVAKLANFMEIDVFVLISCAENTLLDSSEFYKPVVTPYEMELACNTERQWTGQYPTEFNNLLEGGSHYVPIPESIEKEETDVSLVTGKLRRLGRDREPVETGSAVMLRSDATGLATQAETAGDFLNMRSWKGLQQNLGETPVTTAVEGQKGIAMGYDTEPR